MTFSAYSCEKHMYMLYLIMICYFSIFLFCKSPNLMPLGPLSAVAVAVEFTVPVHALLREISPTADACLVLESSVSSERRLR
jgi:hypothetical protein